MKAPREPLRLIDDPQLRGVMKSAEADDDAALLARVAAGLMVGGVVTHAAAAQAAAVHVAVGKTTGAAAVATSGGMTGTFGLAVGWKVALGVVAIGTAASVSTVVVRSTLSSDRAAPTTTAAAREEVVRSCAVSTEPPLPVRVDEGPREEVVVIDAPAPRPSRASTSAVHDEAAVVAAPTLAEEIALVGEMRATVDEDPERTLRLVAEHRARFGESGRFVVDVNGYEALAQDALGLVP